MDYPQLIARTVAELCQSEEIEGVRLSPFKLEPDDVGPLVESLRELSGHKLYLAISAPKVEPYQDEITLIGTGEEAAQQATFWRNRVRSAAGERIVYISYKPWGREGGLRDTLRALDESALREAFLQLPESESLPRAVSAALEEQVSADQLCGLASVVREAGEPWPSLGESLPRVGLARDSALTEENAEERLRLNQAFTRTALGNQARKVTGRLKAELDQFRRARSAREEVSVDLGQFSTEVLDQELGGGQKSKRKAKAKKGAKKAKKKRRKKASSSGAAERADAPTPDLEGGEAGADGEPKLAVLAQAAQAAAAGVPSAVEALARALLDGRGAGLELRVGGSPRRLLQRSLSKSAELLEAESQLAPLQAHVQAVEAAQDELADVLKGRSRRERASLEGLLRAPVLALFDEDLRRAAAGVLSAATGLLEAATESRDPVLALGALLRDSVMLQSRDGDSLLLLGPLHPLWLGQALMRQAQVEAELDALTPAELRVIARAHHQAPAAPQAFPLDLDVEARLAPPFGGLICFEALPAIAGEETLRALGARLTEAFLQVHPYAQLGMRVRLWGQPAPGLVEGMAASLGAGAGLATLTVECGEALPDLRESEAVSALEDGRLALRPHLESGAPPHIEVMVGVPPELPPTDEPAEPEVFGLGTGGDLRTEFESFMGGLRARTRVTGVAGVAEVERALAAAGRRAAQGCFTVTPRGFNPGQVARPVASEAGAWSVVLGRHLARRRPSGLSLLAFEDFGGGLQVAVLARSVAPAGRALGPTLARLGFTSPTALALKDLALQLEGLSRGVISLGGSLSDKLGALLLQSELELQLADGATESLVAEVDGHALRALAAVPDPLSGGVCLGLAEGPPTRVILGYAAVDAALEHSQSRGHLQGALAEFLGSLLETLQAVSAEGELSARSAREALSWLLLPQAIYSRRGGDSVLQLVQELAGGKVAPELAVWIYLPPDACPSPDKRKVTLKGCPVEFKPLDNDLVLKVLYRASS